MQILQARNTNRERLLSAASHASDEKRKRGLRLVTVMIEIAKLPQTISNSHSVQI